MASKDFGDIKRLLAPLTLSKRLFQACQEIARAFPAPSEAWPEWLNVSQHAKIRDSTTILMFRSAA